MIGLIQRVTHAQVSIDGTPVATIGPGMLVLIGIRPSDDLATGTVLIERLLKYRIFADDEDKMNLNVAQIDGDVLLVPQFTLAADTHHGLRPGFSTAAAPAQARPLFDQVVGVARQKYPKVQRGVFGADMQVSLTNDGPVTLWLES